MTIQNPDATGGKTTTGNLETVHEFYGAMPTGVTVSHTGRIFVCHPHGATRSRSPSPSPGRAGGRLPRQDQRDRSEGSRLGPGLGPECRGRSPDRLWILDTGSPMFQPTEYGGPNSSASTWLPTGRADHPLSARRRFPTSYVNDVRSTSDGDGGHGFHHRLSQHGPNGIIVVDLGCGESWRRLTDHPSTKPEPLETFCRSSKGGRSSTACRRFERIGSAMGSDGIAISEDGERLFYCPLGSRRSTASPSTPGRRSHDAAAGRLDRP